VVGQNNSVLKGWFGASVGQEHLKVQKEKNWRS